MVPEEGLVGSDDHEIWEATQNAGRFLITQDLDFSDVRIMKYFKTATSIDIRL
jgi:predicted nuclease of predicted toxin-antitoxin system